MTGGSRAPRRLAFLVLLLASIALVTAVPTSPASGSSSEPLEVAPATASPPATPAPALAPAVAGEVGVPPSSANTTSGPGVFYTSTALPSPSFANQTCVTGLCYNDSNDVATNFTSRGLLAVAYTSLTDRSPCTTQRALSVSNIAFVSSSNLGRTWTHVKYLGNPVCTGASAQYPDAWEPSLTSLADGTLVLVYVEYNLTAGSLPPLTPTTWPPSESRLVLTESSNNGGTWSTPQVLNISNPSTAPPGVQYTPALPSVTAFGDTIYVTWMSLSFTDSEGSVAMVVSTDGGTAWSPVVTVSTGYGAYYSMDPQATVSPTGELFIAYTTNVSFNYFWCGLFDCYYFDYGAWTGSVWVASSDYNGTVFDYSMVAGPVVLGSPGWGPSLNPTSFGPFQTPAPQIAYSAATDQVYVAFTADTPANGTTDCEVPSSECLAGDLYFYDSPDDGVTWNPGNIGNVIFDPTDIDPSTTNLNATDTVTSVAIAVTGSGAVDLEAGFYNGSTCFGNTCGAATEVVFSTSDDGATFTDPAVVSATYTPEADAWNGEYGAVDSLAGSPLFFWSSNTCPAWATTPCTGYPSSPFAVAQVELSTPFAGSGTSLFFNATGIPTDINWSISVLGNIRSGPGDVTLSVSGIPDGAQILYSAADVNLSLAHYAVGPGGVSPASPETLTRTLGVSVTFEEYVPVSISYQVPSITGIECEAEFGIGACPTFYPACTVLADPEEDEDVGCYSVYFNPIPPTGPQWLPYGQPTTVGLSPTPAASTCFSAFGDCDLWIYNLTLLGWGGDGPGSVSSPNPNITFSPRGPVTESASFVITGVCNYFYYSFNSPPLILDWCQTYTAPLTFSESGLPAGTTWGVTLSGAAGSGGFSAPAPEPIENASAGVGFGGISVWNVPSNNPNYVWEGTADVGATVLLPYSGSVLVNYTLVPLATVSVPLHVDALGLPDGLNGNLTITDLATSQNLTFSVGSGGANATVDGGAYGINGSAVVTTSGISYVVAEVYVTSALVNYTNQSAPNPVTVVLGGATNVTVAYQAEYWVDVSAGVGGQASPSSRWVDAGTTITLRATANSGYYFLGWVGTGPGATSGTQATLSQVVIQPGGAVSELATFARNSAASWTVTVSPSGLPGGAEASMTLGGSTYSGAGVFDVTNLSTGTYAVAFPTIAGGGAAISEYVLESVTASVGLSGSELTVNQDLSVDPVYTTDYLVQTSVVGNGGISPGSGSSWQPAGTTLTIVATPASGDLLEEWTGAFDGGASSVLSNLTTLQTVLAGSWSIVAWFVPAPPPIVPGYDLLLNETGLPAGTAWQFGVSGGPGAAGTTPSLTLHDLSGTYTFEIPTVYASAGVRFVPEDTNGTSVAVTADQNATVEFQEQFLVIAAASGPGSVGGGGWYPAGQSISLSATPSNASFSGWQGSGSGSYSGTDLTPRIVADGPITETATFSTAATSRSSASSVPAVDYLAIGIVVAVLVAVGIAEGFVAGRRRRPPPGTRLPAPASP
ncbi:MAG: hypothetical protein WBE40_03265, partial [Thermoplasmata archaeon]